MANLVQFQIKPLQKKIRAARIAVISKLQAVYIAKFWYEFTLFE